MLGGLEPSVVAPEAAGSLLLAAPWPPFVHAGPVEDADPVDELVSWAVCVGSGNRTMFMDPRQVDRLESTYSEYALARHRQRRIHGLQAGQRRGAGRRRTRVLGGGARRGRSSSPRSRRPPRAVAQRERDSERERRQRELPCHRVRSARAGCCGVGWSRSDGDGACSRSERSRPGDAQSAHEHQGGQASGRDPTVSRRGLRDHRGDPAELG